jgi:hypothetical protein
MPLPPLASAVALLAAAALASCASPRPSELPHDEPWLVVVKSARLPEQMPWITRFAHHTWLDVKRGSEAAWWRAEVSNSWAGVEFLAIDSETARRDSRWNRRGLRVLAVQKGDEARAIADQLPAACAALDAKYAEGYRTWPGPNSNTFMTDLAGVIPQLRFVFDGNAVGKDWPDWFAAGATTSGTGLHLETPLVGAAVGVREGVELHLLSLTAAIRLFPPALALPFLPEIPGGWCDESLDVMPPAPTHIKRRLELPATVDADTGEHAATEVEATWELDRFSVMQLVDGASGGWVNLMWWIDPTKGGVDHGADDTDDGDHVAFAASRAFIHEPEGEREESFLTGIRLDHETGFELPFGRALARVRQQLLEPGKARLRVTITRRDGP